MQDNKNLSPSSPKPAQFNSQGQILLDLTLPGDQLKLETKPLGKGAFGVVYAAKHGNKPVAVKQLLQSVLTDAEKEDFKKEAATMFQVGSRSDHVVRLYSITLQPYYSLVMELMPRGNLHDLLQNNRDKPLLWEVRYRLAMDISTGLSDIHSHGILHCDLKSLNVLLDDRLRAKLTDFGLASVRKNTTRSGASGTKGTPQWMAPETVMGGKSSEASDVYSLGMILWELATHRTPYADLDNAMQVMFQIAQGTKETIPEDCPKDFRALILDCWSVIAKRPKALQVVDRLQPLLESKATVPNPDVPTDAAGKLLDSILSVNLKGGPAYQQGATLTAPNRPTVLQQTPAVFPDVSPTSTPYSQPQSPTSPKLVEEKTPGLTAFQTGYQLYHQGQYAQALPHLQQAAKAGYAPAYIDLGVMYELGLGVNKKLGQAEIWYGKAQERENWFEQQADNDDPVSQFYFGRYYQFAAGAKKNLLKANGWYERAAEQHHAAAQYTLGVCYEQGIGVQPDAAQAATWYQQAAKQNFMNAQYSLALCYDKGLGVPQDNTQATACYQQAAQQGHMLAQYQAAIRCEQGIGVTPNLEQAAEWYQRAAEQGHAAAQNNLGRCYENGQGVKQDDKQAASWYLRATEQGEIDAYYNLGRCYESGKSLKQDDKTAVTWYRRAAEKEHAAAQYELGRCYQTGTGIAQSDQEAVKCYRRAIEQNQTDAQQPTIFYYLGGCYANGKGVEQDVQEAVRWYQRAAEKGHLEAQYDLAWSYQRGLGVKQDHQQAVKWYVQALRQETINSKHARILFYLASCYAQGNGVPKSDEEAIIWYLRAIKVGSTEAQHPTVLYYLASCYAQGNGVLKDDKEAASWYQHAAEKGSADAQYALAQRYQKGQGVKQNDKAAVTWYRQAIEGGHRNAQQPSVLLYLANCYARGKGVLHDNKEAASWYQRAAEKGNTDAQYALAQRYEKGQGVKQDDKAAVTWYRQAIEGGNVEAQKPEVLFYLASCCAQGKGTKQDNKEAVNYYLRAANQGHAEAQRNLVVCYMNGTGVDKDRQQAKQWYDKIAAQDNEHAKNVLKDLLQANPSLAGNPNLFFAPIALKPEDKLDAKALGQLLKCVAEGEQDQAEALIKKDSKLLLAAGNVTDLSGRTFDNITAFQYALWAMDYHMWTMIQKYLPTEAQAKQHTLLESKGTTHGKHFDLQPLLDALKTYVDNYSKWSYEQCVEQWCKKVGGAQKLLPAHVVNEYCRPDRPFDPCPIEWTSRLPRTRAVEAYDGSKWVNGEWFTPLSSSSDVLGSSFAFYRAGARGRGWVGVGRGVGGRGLADFKSLQALWNARTEQLKLVSDTLVVGSQSSMQVGLK